MFFKWLLFDIILVILDQNDPVKFLYLLVVKGQKFFHKQLILNYYPLSKRGRDYYQKTIIKKI